MRSPRLFVALALAAASLSLPLAAFADEDPSSGVMNKHSDSDSALADYAKPADDNTLHNHGDEAPEKRGYKVREIPAPRQASARKTPKR